MSTVKAANLQNTGSGAPTFQNSSGTEIGQLARAWVNFNGENTVAIRDSFNVSSITDNGTGTYTVNFDNAMPNANYCFAGYLDNAPSRSGVFGASDSGHMPNFQTTSALIHTMFISGTNGQSSTMDVVIAHCVFFGD